MKKISYDVVGNILILKFPKWRPFLTKKVLAKKFLKKDKNLTTVLEKRGDIEGQLRVAKLKYLSGIRTNKTRYKENGCLFEFDVSKSYFSSRLSNERKIVCEEIAKNLKDYSKVLVLFSGVGPYPIVLAKILKKQKKKIKIIANELNSEAVKDLKRNIIINKLQDYITVDQGDANNLPKKIKEKFDTIVMPRPNIKDTFLETAFKLSKKGTKIYYHGFGTKEKVLDEINEDLGNKISKIEIRKAGDIAPHKYRWQASFKIKK